MNTRFLWCAACLPVLVACASSSYEQIKTGRFEGRLIVQWEEPNRFLYLPDPAAPLKFTAADGRAFQPRKMYTDAGSIPRLFWSTPGLGPWDFAPGYIIHDWLFQVHRCQLEGWQQISFEYSADILAEAMKTQMEAAKPAKPDPVLVEAVSQAVRSSIAREIWEKSLCEPVPAPPPGAPEPRKAVVRVIDFK